MDEAGLWVGANVRYVGPDVVRGTPRPRTGTPAVVVDPGRYRVTSFGTLVDAGHAPVRRGRGGVVIKLPDGEEVEVGRNELQLVAPDHPLQPEPDGSFASWWLDELDTWDTEGVPVSSLVPGILPAVVQVLHPWWRARFAGEGQPVRWAELARQQGFTNVRELDSTRDDADRIPAADKAGLASTTGQLDRLTAAALVDVLTTATTVPDDVFVAVWVGWGDVSAQQFPQAAHLYTQSRGHFLLRGPLAGVLTSVSASGLDQPTAGLWWPADRAWFVATEVDFPWTFVAGDESLIDMVLQDERLEAGRTSFDAQANEGIEPV